MKIRFVTGLFYILTYFLKFSTSHKNNDREKQISLPPCVGYRPNCSHPYYRNYILRFCQKISHTDVRLSSESF